MSRRYFARRKDASHEVIVRAFRALGCSVVVVESSKAGCPDLAVGCAGRTHLVECKPLRKDAFRKSQTVASAEQRKFFEAWRGGVVPVVHDAKEVAELAELWRLEASNADRAAQLLKRELDAVLEKVNA